MYWLKDSQRKSARQTNAEITREQLRIQGAKMRASIRAWYQRLTRRKPAAR
jgi:hypothetical protein